MKSFKKYYLINTSPEDLYKALTLPHIIQLWSGEKAEMNTTPNSEFSLWDGAICGRNIEFEEGKKIVQHWYFGEENEDSVVTIKLHPHNKGTSVELIHTNIPDEDFEDIVEGWDDEYWGALTEFYQPE
ncbi:MAG: SRPBCC domain-containing protein [Bacteroidetes bacterium]|nr:SRPBCC domain-containing protein [Bacteroidota bacterium]